MNRANIQHKIFNVTDAQAFNELALEIFRYQAENNVVYRQFLEFLKIEAANLERLEQIPFLPIDAFKSHAVKTGDFEPKIIFTSSGTSGYQTSKHNIRDLELYHSSFFRGFDHFYKDVRDYCILALLPSYLERSGSSLIYMAQGLMNRSAHPNNGFYLDQLDDLHQVLRELAVLSQPTILLGVSYALLDLAEQFPQPLQNTIIMETGGMKGRRKELTRTDLHNQLKEAFGVHSIHSEYGMTELLSQAYSTSDGRFECPPWMRVLVREQADPLSYSTGKTGGINVIDLANIDSCSFIATSDLGRTHRDRSFEVLGRFDYSDVRGCNLMVG